MREIRPGKLSMKTKSTNRSKFWKKKRSEKGKIRWWM